MREINSQELEQLKSEGKKMLVDIFATWCGPCKALMPKLEQMSTNYQNIDFVSLDVDKNMEFCKSLGVRSVPTVLIYDGQKLINSSTGNQPESFYKKILDSM